jgi:hypothetical protein
MTEQTTIRTNSAICETQAHGTNVENSSAEGSQAHETQLNGLEDWSSSPEHDLLLELVIRHFRDLKLQSVESRQLASGILQAVETGEPQSVGPVGEPARRYQFHRRFAALSIRVGQGRIRLPLRSAVNLANALHGVRDPRLVGAIAA